MVKKQQREDHREWNPESQLLVNSHMSESIQKKKAGDRNPHGRCVIDINGSDEIALLPLELQAAVETIDVHGERASKQTTHAATRTVETKARTQHR
jgi:hypothetical protein